MKLLGNTPRDSILVFIFIIILCALAWRCSKAADIDVRGGISFGGKSNSQGPVLGLNLYFPQGKNVDLYAGATLWGETPITSPNWDWHAGFRTCRWRFCANLGASYLQNPDDLDGSKTNFNLGLSYELNWWRIRSLSLNHLSNAGTVFPNYGRNAVMVDFKLQ